MPQHTRITFFLKDEEKNSINSLLNRVKTPSELLFNNLHNDIAPSVPEKKVKETEFSKATWFLN